MKPRSHRPSCGFTLVELLVVIVIIAVLAALSIGGFTRMRAAADRSTTVGILRQLQIANTGYAGDHNGAYVPIAAKNSGGGISMEWFRDPSFLVYLTGDEGILEKPSNQEVVIPVNLLDPVVYRAKQRHYLKLSASFGFNSTGLTYPQDDKSAPYCYKVSQIADPTRTAFVITATDYTVTYASRKLWKSAPVEGKTTNSKMAYRHDDKAAVVYYDGSSGFITWSDIERFDAAGGINHPFWKAKP